MLTADRVSVVPRCYTIAETAIILNVSDRTVYRLIDRGDLKTCGSGKLLRVLASSIEEYLANDRKSRFVASTSK